MSTNKNIVIVTGTPKNIFFSNNGKQDYMSFGLVVADPDRHRNDGTPFTYRLNISASGIMATNMKTRLTEDSKVCVEGRFEPRRDKNGVDRYNIVANNIDLNDAGQMNHVVIQGRLTSDPDVRITSNDNHVVSFSLAVNRSYRKGGKDSTEWEQLTYYVNVTAWGDLADFVGQHKKGNQLWVIGKMVTRKWTDKEGNDHYPTEVVAASVIDAGTGKYTGNKNNGDNSAASAPKKSEAQADPQADIEEYADFDEDEELPF